MALVTAAEVRAQLPELLAATDEDTNLGVLIAGVGEAFARFCGYLPATAGATPTMESASYVLYLTGDGGRDLRPSMQPVTAVASIYDDGSLDFTDSAYLVASTDYAIVYDIHRGSVIRLTSSSTWGQWSTAEGAIKVSCTAGYTSIPAGLKQIAIMAVRNWIDLRRRRGKTSESNDAGSVSYSDEDFLPPHVCKALASYQLSSTGIG